MPDSANLGRTTSIKHQNQLVQSYLDSLLSDVTAVAAEETETVSWPEQAQAQQPAEVQLSDHSPAQAAPSKSIDFVESSEAERQQEPQRIEETDAGSVLSAQAPEIVTETEAVAQGRPEWAEETFASLLFEVAGNDLAAPLHELGGICPLTDNLKFLAGQADWFLGLLNWNGRQLRVVDTAKLLMAETILENSLEEDYQSVIILGNSNWALAVNRADKSVRLDPQDVKWRKHRGNRHWLAGTLQDQLSSLIDVSALRRQLDGMDESLKDMLEADAGMDPASNKRAK